MHLFYKEDYDINNPVNIMDGEEFNHISRSLRLGEGEVIHVTNGKGLKVKCEIENQKRNSLELKTIDYTQERRPEYLLDCYVSPVKNRNRLEFMVEKLVELGINKLVFMNTENSERHKVKLERLNLIAISAMKQSLQYFKMKIEYLSKINQFNSEAYDMVGLAHCHDQRKNEIKDLKGKKLAFMIGPEGDFSENEVNLLLNKKFLPISLVNTLLRTETAALYTSSLLKDNL